MLSGIADYTGNKKKFLKRFCLLGSISVMSLFFFTGKETLWVGIVFTILASIGFWGSIVFYNAYLPEVAHPEQQDDVSAKGFIFGYSGSILLLLLSLVMINKPELFGLPSAGFASRLTFLIVGVWWFGFAQITYAKLPNNVYNRTPKKDFIWKGLRELKIVAKELKKHPELKLFLSSKKLSPVPNDTTISVAAKAKTASLKASILLMLCLSFNFFSLYN